MKFNIVVRSLFIVFFLSTVPFRSVLADGVPVIIVEPSVTAPGAQVTITGTDMEDGEVFKITLEGAAGVFELGEATAVPDPDGQEAGFTAVFTLPSDLTAGYYLLRAATDEGETATADLTIGGSSEKMNAQPMEASAEPMSLDRPRAPGLVASVVLVALLSAGLGLWLIRKPGLS